MVYKIKFLLTISKSSGSPVWGCRCTGCMEALEYGFSWLLWGLRPPQFLPEGICCLFFLHLPRRSSKKNPHVFLEFSKPQISTKASVPMFYQPCKSFWFPEPTPCLLRELFHSVTKLSATANIWCLCPLSVGWLQVEYLTCFDNIQYLFRVFFDILITSHLCNCKFFSNISKCLLCRRKTCFVVFSSSNTNCGSNWTVQLLFQRQNCFIYKHSTSERSENTKVLFGS